MTPQTDPKRDWISQHRKNPAEPTSETEQKPSDSSGSGRRRVEQKTSGSSGLPERRGGQRKPSDSSLEIKRRGEKVQEENSQSTQKRRQTTSSGPAIHPAKSPQAQPTTKPKPNVGESSEHLDEAMQSERESPKLDEKFHQMAAQGLENFINEIVTGAVTAALKAANVSLMASMASSAIAPIPNQKEAFEWLALRGGKHLADWAKKNHSLINQPNNTDNLIKLASKLDTYIHGAFSKDKKFTEIPHPDVGQEVVRFLQSLGMPRLFQEKLSKSPEYQRSVLEVFKDSLDQIDQSPQQNQSLFGYMLQQIATQSFSMLVGQLKNTKTQEVLFQELFQAIQTKLEMLENSPRAVFIVNGGINTGGGSYISGIVKVSGDLIGRDKIITDSCCAQAEGAPSVIT